MDLAVNFNPISIIFVPLNFFEGKRLIKARRIYLIFINAIKVYPSLHNIV